MDEEPRNNGTEPHLIVVEYESTIPWNGINYDEHRDDW